jgi:hypothetical protein
MFGGDRRDSAIAMPLKPLTDMYAEPARRYIESRGGVFEVSSPAQVRVEHGRVTTVAFRGRSASCGAVVVAVPWFALSETVCGDVGPIKPILTAARGTGASPIVTVNLWLDRPVLETEFVGLPGRTFQWIFDKRQVFGDSANHLSLVCSGAAAVAGQPNEWLIRLATSELRAAVPRARDAAVVRGLAVRERRATFSLAPGQPARPGNPTPIHGLFLAGDWTDTGLPATIEGAALSGHRAADAVAGARGGPARGDLDTSS